jgi:chromosome segregation ATPase
MKSKQVHEKFPATEEFQRKSKDQAEKEYKAIDDKFEKKNASLNSLAVEAAENIIPSVLGFLTAGGSSKEQQKLQERFDSLQRTCQQFKQQFEEQKKFIEDLQNAKKGLENKCSTLETKYQKVQSEWGLTKNRQTQFDQDVKPEVAAHSKGILNLKQELSAAKENITQLLATKSQIPDNLKQQLEKIDRLSTRVNDFPSIRLELDKIRRESTVATKDITEEVKKLGTRVDSLESAISGVEGRQGLNHYVVDLVEWQQNLISAGIPSTRELVALSDKVTRLERSTTKSPQPKTESPDMSSLHKRVTQVERLVDPLPKKIQSCEESTSSFFKASAAENLKDSINTQISEVDKRLRGLEDKFTSTTNFKERLEALEAKGNSISRVTGEVKALETRLVKVEQEPPIAQQPTTTSPTSVQGNATMPRDVSSRLDSLGQAVDTFREQLDQMKEGNNAIMNSIGDTIDGQVQRATEEIGRQITSIESKLLGLDNSSDPTSHESLSALPQKFEDFRQAHAETIRSQNDEIKNAKDTLVAVAAARAVDILRSTPDALPPPDLQQRLIGHVNTMVNQLNSSLTTTLATYQDEIYANANNVNSLETRVNNINTGAIAAYMADQVLERFPHLQTTEATMIGFRTTLQGVTSEIQGLSNSVRHLQRGSQEPATATDSKAFKDLRLEVDKLTTNVTAANSMTKKTKDTVAEMQGDLQWTKEAMATLQEDAKDTKERLAVLVEDAKTTKERVETQGQSIIANNNYATEQITKFDTDIEKVSSDIEKISSDIDTMKEAATEPAPRSATSQVSSTNTPNGSKAIKSALAMPARYGRQGSAASAVSDGSLPSTANGSNKGAKPKLPTPGNRQPSMSSDTGNKKRKIPNGTSPTTSLGPNGTASNNSSPRKKARRKGYLDGDDPEDDDYDLPQPGLMSSDDDEL